jgi:hypothetical protein
MISNQFRNSYVLGNNARNCCSKFKELMMDNMALSQAESFLQGYIYLMN